MNNKDYIEFTLYKAFFEGRVTRKDLVERFGVKESKASQIFSITTEEHPGHIRYHPKSRGYIPTDDYRIKKEYLFSDYLRVVGSPEFIQRLEPINSGVNMDKYRVIHEAINEGFGLEFYYLSLNTPEPTKRLVFPHSLINSGYRWHIRGWEEGSGVYKDFNLPRMQGELRVVKTQKPKNCIKKDVAWGTQKTFFLIPNPKLSEEQRKIIEIDYQMSNGVLTVSCKKALFLYTLHTFLVTDQSEFPNIYQHLALRQ